MIILFALGLLEGLERWSLDTQFLLRGPEGPRSPIVIVSIDEDSFDELNLPWPWPRALHAQLLDTIGQGHPAVTGLDLVFAEPSSFGPEDDTALAEAVGRAGNVVLAAARTVVEGGSFVKEDLNPPIAEIRDGAAGYGPVDLPLDDDAYVRRAALVHLHQGRDLPSFDLLLARRAEQAGIPSRSVAGSRFLINYRGGPRTFPTVPYYRVLNGEIPPEAFAGKIVLIGATSPILHDQFPTPFAPQGTMSGVEIHANVLETYLQGIPVTRIPGWATALLMLGAAVAAVWVADRMRPLRALGLVLAAVAAYVSAAFAAFVWARLWEDVAAVCATVGVAYGAAVLENYVREQREKRRLSRFFSPAVLTEIVRHRRDLALGGTRRRITVLFSDIRGFTSMSEKLSPEQVVQILTDYLTELTEVVFTHGGTVDKYIGDCIMALYNVPIEDPDHAVHAVRTALEFQRRTEALSARWEARLGVRLRNGVGINTGDAVVGTMGARQRMEYTAIGDTVNLAARLESVTKDFRTPIVISESTYQEVHAKFRTRCLGEVAIKGKELPVKIYAVAEEADVNIRRDVRVALEATVKLSDGDVTVLAALTDVSRSGLAVHGLPKEFAMGQTVRLILERSSRPPIELKGQVAWCVEDRAGLRFIEVTPEAGIALAGLLGEVASREPVSEPHGT